LNQLPEEMSGIIKRAVRGIPDYMKLRLHEHEKMGELSCFISVTQEIL
jgi:hypothetical protein